MFQFSRVFSHVTKLGICSGAPGNFTAATLPIIYTTIHIATHQRYCLKSYICKLTFSLVYQEDVLKKQDPHGHNFEELL